MTGARMELRHLRALVTVAETGSITAASKRLRLAQPALSRQLRALEQEIDASLLERSARGVLLTEAGKAFAADARGILAAAEAAATAARARARGTVGELRLGYAPSPTAEVLPAALRTLAQAAPAVNVVLHDLGGDELLLGLESGELQFVVMVDPGELLPANVIFRPLQRYAHCVAFGSHHPFGRLRSVPLTRLADEPLVVYDRRHYGEYRRTLAALLAPVTRAPNIALECDGLTSLIAAVTAGRGVAVVPEVFRRFSGEGIRLRKISPPPDPLVIGYAHRVDVPLAPIARRLIKILLNLARGTAAERPRSP